MGIVYNFINWMIKYIYYEYVVINSICILEFVLV